MSETKLRPLMLEIGSLYEIEQDGVKEKYVVMHQEGNEQWGAIKVELRPVMKGKGDLIIRFLGKPVGGE